MKTDAAYFNEEECYRHESVMFIQVACVFDEQEVIDRQLVGLFIACMAVFLGLLMLIYVNYIKKLQESRYLEWDVKTITAGDYTIEFALDPNFYGDFIEKEMEAWNEKCKKENRIFPSRAISF